jgi:hypothetical protein
MGNSKCKCKYVDYKELCILKILQINLKIKII